MSVDSSSEDLFEIPFAERLGYRKQPPSYATRAIHTAQDQNKLDCSSVIPLINLTSTYKLAEAHNPYAYQYSRFGNPTRNALEKCLAALDSAKYSITFASGLGAQTAIISSLKKGNGIVIDQDVNLDSIKLFKNFAVNMKMDVKVIDVNDVEKLKSVLNDNVKLVWIETPASVTMKVIDIQTTCDLIHKSCDAKVVADNTSLSSYFQRPLEFGADIVIYSITKYLHGHSDVVMGSLAINDDDLFSKLKYHQGAIGIIPSPFDCFMVNRSLKTLALRMEHHMRSSVYIAKWLQKQPKVLEVLHPALNTHKNHQIALTQSYGHSGIFSFYLKDVNLIQVESFLKALKVFMLIESPAGFESFMRSPIMTTHCMLNCEELKEIGVTDGLIYVSVGLEDVEDLVEDIRSALEAI